MKRGEIYYADLDPTVGSESGKRRPVLIISNDIGNRAGNLITVLPLTSNVTRIYPFEVFLTVEVSGLPKPSKVQAQQIRTISKNRIQSQALVRLSKTLMEQVDRALKLHLSL
jgi:mRNA interferase MazF